MQVTLTDCEDAVLANLRYCVALNALGMDAQEHAAQRHDNEDGAASIAKS